MEVIAHNNHKMSCGEKILFYSVLKSYFGFSNRLRRDHEEAVGLLGTYVKT